MSEHWYNRKVPTLLGIVVSLLVLAVVLIVFLAPANSAPLARSNGASASFSFHATPATSAQLASVGLRSKNCPVGWIFAPSGWGVQTLSGAWWYAFTSKTIWCANTAKTKIVGLAENRCINRGGFWNFDWCKHQHQKPGYGSMDLWPTFEYYLPKSGFYRHPHIDLTVYPNGNVSGTAYTDASTISNYP